MDSSTAAGSPTSDNELVLAMQRGDEAALTALFRRHSALVRGVALRQLCEPAEADEVVVDVFSAAWRTASRYDRKRGSVLAWLINMTRSRAIDRLRSQASRRAAMERAARLFPEVGPDRSQPTAAERGVQRAEYARVMESALSRLRPERRVAVTLAFYEGLSHSEVADRLGVPLGTVKTRIRQGMADLGQMLHSLREDYVS